MIVLVWNIRGLNSPLKQREVKSLVKRLKISIFCLVETRVKEGNAEVIQKCIAPSWGFIHNYSRHYNGRIWVCWNPNLVNICGVHVHAQSITCEISEKVGPVSWIHSFVYGSNCGIER